jgi:hypothetical protein
MAGVKGRPYGSRNRAPSPPSTPLRSPTGLVRLSIRLKPGDHRKLTQAAEDLEISAAALISELLQALETTTEIDPETGTEIKTARVAWSGQAPAALPLSA